MDYISGLFLFMVDHAPLLAGVILTPFVDFLNRDVPDGQERFIVAAMTCLVAAALINWRQLVNGSPEMVAASFFIIFTESQTVFRLYFKTSLLRSSLQESISAPIQR